MKKLLTVLLLLAAPVYAGPKKVARAVAREFTETLKDTVRHPIRYGLPFLLQASAGAADMYTSCKVFEQGGTEQGPGRFVLGRHPSCGRTFATGIVMHFTSFTLQHYISRSFEQKCRDEANNPDSRWNRTEAHTHDPSGCGWAVPWAATITYVPLAAATAAGNAKEIQ